MCYDNNTAVQLMRQVQKYVHDIDTGIDIQVAGRLIGKDNTGLEAQRTRDRNTLLLSAGDLGQHNPFYC